MYVLALIGPIAAGKSIAASYLGEKGATIVDLDDISRQVVGPGSHLLAILANRFGEDILDDEGVLDRGLLAQRAFVTQEDTDALDAIMHPAIAERFASYIVSGSCSSQLDGVIVVQIPLLKVLDEIGVLVDGVMCIDAPEDQRVVRGVARGHDPIDMNNRVDRQPSGEEYRQVADVVIENHGSIEELHLALDEWWDQNHGGGRRGR